MMKVKCKYIKFFLFLNIYFFAGCSEPYKKKVLHQKSKAMIEKRAFNTGEICITKRNDKREILWQVNAITATIDFEGPKKLYSSLYKVKGKLYKRNRIECEFFADQVILDQFNNFINISGNILATNRDKNITLKADNIKWLMQKHLIKAKGKVIVSSKDFVFGPCAEVVASANLENIGTPDLMNLKNEKNNF